MKCKPSRSKLVAAFTLARMAGCMESGVSSVDVESSAAMEALFDRKLRRGAIDLEIFHMAITLQHPEKPQAAPPAPFVVRALGLHYARANLKELSRRAGALAPCPRTP